MTKQKIIIDTDPGCDDMLAILLMCASPLIDIKAITTVAGNSTLQNVTNNARYILDIAQCPDLPLYPGASKPLVRDPIQATVHGTSGLETATAINDVPLNNLAVDKILDIVRASPGEISLLILGPQTNIAAAIRQSPETMKLARAFVIMGGAFTVPGNQTIAAEFNICADPEAAAIVAGFPVAKTYIPLDLCNQIQVPLSEFARIQNTQVRTAVTTALSPYIRNIQRNELKSQGALMYDVLAAYYLLAPEVCTTRNRRVIVETNGTYTYGMTLIDYRASRPNATIVTDIPAPHFINDYFRMLNKAM